MKTLQAELPDQLAHEVKKAVEAGKIAAAAVVERAALREFNSQRRFELIEQQQLSDIGWTLGGVKAR